jgi:O-methyltransferase domain
MDASASKNRPVHAGPAGDGRATMRDMITAYRISRVVRCAATFSLAVRTVALEDRLTAEGGDLFKSVLTGGNMYLLRYVPHDWNDAGYIQVLQSCRVAMIRNANLYVLEIAWAPWAPMILSYRCKISIYSLSSTAGNERSPILTSSSIGQAEA